MANQMEISGLLAEMQALRNRAIDQRAIPDETRLVGERPVPDFSQMLDTALNKVNDVQHQSKELKMAFERGEPGVDITEVMVASQKATVAFEAVKQVRNKLMEAYRDVMNMPI